MNPKVAVFGTGYVGLVSGVCISDFGLNVTCVDIDEEKIESLKKGKVPIYEPGLDVLLERNIKANRISFTTNDKESIESNNVIFIAVGTPSTKDGEADLSYVYKVASTIGEYINHYTVIVNKSTVPIGTGQEVKKIISKKLKTRGVDIKFDVVSNPEFLREGKAIQDFTHPDRIIIGSESEQAIEIMKKVYRPLYINETPFIVSNIETAEMIKYASNAFLATKITFINEIANLCEKVGADVKFVAKAMGRDGRIGPKFLHPGPGFGGSCFPKDVRALNKIGEKHDVNMSIIKSVIDSNERQKVSVVKKLQDTIGSLKGKTIAVLGLSFKPETDDMREAPSLQIITDIISSGGSIRAYDPQAMEESKRYLDQYLDKITYCKHSYDAAEDTDAVIIVTEWHEFRNMDVVTLKKIMKSPIFYDSRNIYSRKEIEKYGFVYIGTGA